MKLAKHTRMNTEQMRSCPDISSLLVKRIAGELSADEKNYVESHLAGCASCTGEEQGLSKVWQKFDTLPDPEIPPKLYEATHETILGHLKWETSSFPWIVKISEMGAIWSAILPILAGLVMTGISYSLVRNLVGSGVHHHYVFLPLFGLWWLVFGICFWLLLKPPKGRMLHLNVVAAHSILVTLLTLIMSFLAYETELFRGPAMFAASKVAAGSLYLFGIGNSVVTAWWIHCCLASFIGALTFSVRQLPLEPRYLLVGSLVVTTLLLPAILLQGASHNHGYGIIAFAALGTYVGSLLGLSLGFFLRRQIFFQPV
jgi:Putative zinc-finger